MLLSMDVRKGLFQVVPIDNLEHHFNSNIFSSMQLLSLHLLYPKNVSPKTFSVFYISSLLTIITVYQTLTFILFECFNVPGSFHFMSVSSSIGVY